MLSACCAQAQNEQLKMQCCLLTEELSKLRQTFDAILKAGDNLQADYDQLQAEKEKLQDQLEGLAREKEEVGLRFFSLSSSLFFSTHKGVN